MKNIDSLLLILAIFAPSVFGQDQTPIALPSTMPLKDYEENVLYPWLWRRGYTSVPGWRVDTRVRDTGPFIDGRNYGVHPAVRIHYSPEVVKWLENGRKGELPDGSMIIKEMMQPPAAIYEEVGKTRYFMEHPGEYEKLLAALVTGWTAMIKDSGGKSKDGWFWAGPGENGTPGNFDDYSHVLTSGFGVGTCIRCHASAESESTFVSTSNFWPDKTPLQYRVDNSWRSKDYLDQKSSVTNQSTLSIIKAHLRKLPVPEAEREQLLATLTLPSRQRPWTKADVGGGGDHISEHMPRSDGLKASPRGAAKTRVINADFSASFQKFTHLKASSMNSEITNFSFPPEFADHVYPSTNAAEYITSDNCYGCHGGLGGAPFGLSMFIQTGTEAGQGYNVSEFGEWRWSPMGLAGRDPIFHSQLESELIILLKENGQLTNGRPASGLVLTNQQALIDTCLRCHGAMGLRQKGIDSGQGILNPHFDPNLFYITKPLTKQEEQNPPFKPQPNQTLPPAQLDYGAYRLGDLAREGISCAICHHLAPPEPKQAMDWAAEIRKNHPRWLGTPIDTVWSDSFFFFAGMNNTGLYERSATNEIFGPFADVQVKPMQNAMGIIPKVAPPMDKGDPPFTADSAMCGTCHTINLPNIGATNDKFPVLTALEPNLHFQNIPHSIEQATYLEWLNSKFGLGKDNKRGPGFQSCQDCHMPNRFAAPNDPALPKPIEPLASQIASIQDSAYPQAEHQLPAKDIFVATRADYRRHELVGFNGFLIEMFKQFSDVLGVAQSDYETGATNGADLAIQNMVLSAKESRIATVKIASARIENGNLLINVEVANKTGHRFPSGVAFRRAWVEMLVLDAAGKTIWSSGRANGAGVIVDTKGNELATEFLTGNAYQENHQIITSDQQVQIYEELTRNAAGNFTSSFVHRVKPIKDNRLLPEGWVPGAEFTGKTPKAGIGDQGDLLLELMESTDPEGEGIKQDPDFTNSPSTGIDHFQYSIPLADFNGQVPASVQAALYSQSLMPAWFAQRFSLAQEAKEAGYNTPATDRLFYIATHLNLTNTPLEGWKFKVAATQPVLLKP